ncbi:Crp/Fnr family transcriptional regulator [Proteiniborus sp.]|uniref:Crp/Fnr family transcriptional regulator n=1 Tax=Proteiniborus sp. TaxID=2079015 RepID=UPI00332471AD
MNINNYKDLLTQIHLFSMFSPDEMVKFFESNKYKIKSYNKNSIIYLQNERCSTVDVILEGSVAVQKIDENGDVLTITTLSTGDIMGGNLVFSQNNQYPMTIIATANCKVIHIKKVLIIELCQRNKEFLVEFFQCLSDKTLILTDKIKFISIKSIRDKIYEFLNYEHYIQQSTTIKLNISKKELAEKLGIQRPSFFRELSKMKKEGLIDYDSKTITILYRS